MQTAINIIIALIIFSILVVFHEFGHFIVAKKNGVVVLEFSVGMGPRLLSRVAKSGTRYSLKLLPIGGSCAMLGEDEDNTEEGSFNSKSVWARMAIVFAGPFFNFILAFVFSVIGIAIAGTDMPDVVDIDKNSAAYEAGLRTGDRIVNYNGASIGVGREIYLEEYVNPLDGEPIKVTYIRDGQENTIEYKPDSADRYMLGLTYTESSREARIDSVSKDSSMDMQGVRAGDVIIAIDGNEISSGTALSKYLDANPPSDKEMTITIKRNGRTIDITAKPMMTTVYSSGFVYNLQREKQSVLGVLKYSFIEMRYEINMVLKSLKMLVTGKVSANEVSGPVGIVNVIGDAYSETKSEGFKVTALALMSLAVMLSANLGVMNLLPIPALDGGRILLYLVEIITRKPIPKDKEGMIHFVGFVLLMMLMLFLVFNDIRKIIY
jgi:regulator of sigma E protease